MQTKACGACCKKGHMAASCPVPKTKLNCKHHDMKGLHTTNPCFKKQKEDKNKDNFKDDRKKWDPANKSPKRVETSEDRRRAASLSYKGPHSNSQTSYQNMYVQIRLRDKDTSEEKIKKKNLIPTTHSQKITWTK